MRHRASTVRRPGEQTRCTLRDRILGAIAVVWGSLILVGRLGGGDPIDGAGAYAAGQMTGLVFAVLLLVVGLYYLTRRTQSRRPKSS
jgi:hypothetical protein